MRLVGVGVGPGDPQLLTLAGLRELGAAGRIFVPTASLAEPGRAEAVVRAALPAGAPIERLTFALADDVRGPQHRRRARWDEAAGRVADYLREHGGTAAFATLGDPMIYSTFGYLAPTVRALLPGLKIGTVPGITAMQAAASATGMPLVEGAESLTVVPLSREVTGLRTALRGGGTVVAYKGGRRLDEVRAEVQAAGALDRSVYAEHLGTPRARVRPLSDVAAGADLDGAEQAPYLSTVVILPPRGGRGEQL
ncbi:MAG: precorrin-2 C(20)-methyltransferase [Kutzneria sp.]|nr:precorrin-2 C(20)-methyltransferase [Kutzneria sp.]